MMTPAVYRYTLSVLPVNGYVGAACFFVKTNINLPIYC